MRNDRPGRTRKLCVYGRLLRNDGLAHDNREIELILPEQVFRNRCQYRTGLRVFGVGIRKLQSAIQVLFVPFILSGAGEQFLLLAVSKNRRVSGLS